MDFRRLGKNVQVKRAFFNSFFFFSFLLCKLFKMNFAYINETE